MEMDSNERSCIGCCSCLNVSAIFIVGLVFVSVIAALMYHTVEAAFGRMDFCTLWTDVPGRLAIFTICYYLAGVCGCLPIPDSLLWECLPKPFMPWKLDTWRDIFSILLSSVRRIFIDQNVRRIQAPLLQEQREERHEEQSYYQPFIRRVSEPIPIIYPQNAVHRGNVRWDYHPWKETPDTGVGFEESMSFDSPTGGHIAPMPEGRPTRDRYLPDASESSSDSVTEQAEFFPDEQQEQPDTPPRTPSDTDWFSGHPRCPWVLLRNPGGIPNIARKLHEKNLRIERLDEERRLAELNARNTASGVENRRDGGEFSKVQPQKPPSGNHRRRRTHSATASLGDLRMKLHSSRPKDAPKSSVAQKNPDETKDEEEGVQCCINSPDLHLKVDCIQRAFVGVDELSQTGTGPSGVVKSVRKSEEPEKEDPAKVHKPAATSSIPITGAKPKRAPDVRIQIQSEGHKSSDVDSSSSD